MRSEAFGKVFKGTARLCGLDPARFNPELAESLAGWLAQRITQAWEAFPWPELCVVEERFYARLYRVANVTYAANEVVRVTTAGATVYYTLMSAPSQAVTPGTNEAVWATTTPDRTIDLEQPTGWEATDVAPTPLGEVLEVWRMDPRKFPGARPVSFQLIADALWLDPLAPASVFVKYRRRPSDYTATAWDATTNYAPGDVVFYNNECYVAGAQPNLAAFLTVSGGATLNGVPLDGQWNLTSQTNNARPVFSNTLGTLLFFIYTPDNGVTLVWVIAAPPNFQLAVPYFTGSGQSSTDPGTAGGHVYTAVGTHVGTPSVVRSAANVAPGVAGATWTLVRVPHVLANYARRAAVADFLADDGQMDKAFAQERRAADWLEEQFIAATLTQGGQTANYSVAA